jgi:hypothetical protein
MQSMKECVLSIVFAVALALATPVQPALAQDESENAAASQAADLVKPPPLPPKVQDEQIEPTVTIREEEDQLIEEYRYNGEVYMIKVTPERGIPYYFIDTDGDGKLEKNERLHSMEPVDPVHWKLWEWK